MTRPQDWPEQLDAYVAAHSASAFKWSKHDCATFAAGWRERMTGKTWAPVYTSAREAAEYIAGLGGMGAAASLVLGDPMLYPKSAQRGDIALVQVADRKILGIVRGIDVIGPGEAGLLAVPRRAIVMAWRIV